MRFMRSNKAAALLGFGMAAFGALASDSAALGHAVLGASTTDVAVHSAPALVEQDAVATSEGEQLVPKGDIDCNGYGGITARCQGSFNNCYAEAGVYVNCQW
jgi:hypothetical protein